MAVVEAAVGEPIPIEIDLTDNSRCGRLFAQLSLRAEGREGAEVFLASRVVFAAWRCFTLFAMTSFGRQRLVGWGAAVSISRER